MKRISVIFWSAVVLFLLALYGYIYVHLENDLKTIFDEGIFFLGLKFGSSFVVQAPSLSLCGAVEKAFFPCIEDLDVLALRRLAFGVKGIGMTFLLISSCFFLYKDRKEKQLSSYLVMVACILLMGLFVMPSVVISSNDMALFFEMTSLSFCLLTVSTTKKAWEYVCMGLTGLSCFFAMLVMPPGGVMIGVLCFLFLIFYRGFDKKKLLEVFFGMFSGVAIGVVIMHLFVISLPEVAAFIKQALDSTSDGANSSHHSLANLFVQFLLNIRDLIMTVTILCGVAFVSDLVYRKCGRIWLAVLVGVLLFVILYKWQVKPGIGFASIVSWLLLMTLLLLTKDKKNVVNWNDVALVMFLWLLPFGQSLGSNLGFLYKSTVFIMPWGVLLFFMYYLTKQTNQLFAKGILAFVFALVLFNNIRGMARQDNSDTVAFAKEYPIARMQLNKDQYSFFEEVYGIMEDYDYRSKMDTVLAFCFNEMTIVAIDAVPYTSDQLPNEFLLHDKNKLVRPTFMILSEWDLDVLETLYEELGWNYPDAYDRYELINNPDPNAGYSMTQSTLFCLKDRRRFVKE